MATKTSMPKAKSTHRAKRKEMKVKTPHSSLLMMLSSQLLETGRFNEGLPSFIMHGLDSEQIWQQLELRNEHSLSFPACTREVVRISSGTHRYQKKSQNLEQLKVQPVDSGLDNDDDKQSSELDSSEEDDDEVLNSIKKRLTDKSSNEDDGFDDIGDDEDNDELDFDFQLNNELLKDVSDEEQEKDNVVKKLPTKSIVKRVSVVDDKFFKLADAEEFLDSEDLKEEKKRQREEKGSEIADDEDEEDDSEDIDIFGGLDSGDDDTQGAKYSDFFDPPDDSIATKQKENTEKKSKVKKNDSDEDKLETSDEDIESEVEDSELVNDIGEVPSEAEDDNDEERAEEEEEVKVRNKENLKKVSFTSDLLQSDDETEMQRDTKSNEIKSTFELKQEQLQAKAREMEEQSLKEVSWELTGEVSSSKRPENSLLDTVMDFQHTTKAAPVITDETTKTLEDYIKQRIKDKTFDDVERKEKPKEDVFEFKKRIVLDQEKSKQSLGDLYEQEFLKQQQTQTDEVKADPECEKIEKDLSKLFHQLDALSNFRYTPMRPGTEVKIIVNTPAITMEEVAPVATADSELLAPEEIYEKKKGDLKAADERSSTDKKRARRQKKKEKQERKKAKEAREKVVDKLKPGLGNKYSKAKALKQLSEISKTDRNVTLIKGDHKKLSSSSFFTQLQEEVQTNAKAKKATKENKKKIVDASKLML